jgi:hypothetical protein
MSICTLANSLSGQGRQLDVLGEGAKRSAPLIETLHHQSDKLTIMPSQWWPRLTTSELM